MVVFGDGDADCVLLCENSDADCVVMLGIVMLTVLWCLGMVMSVFCSFGKSLTVFCCFGMVMLTVFCCVRMVILCPVFGDGCAYCVQVWS